MKGVQYAALASVVFVTSAFVQGCGDDGDRIIVQSPSAEPTPEPSGTIQEKEPNGSPPQDLGELAPGQRFRIVGSVSFSDDPNTDDEIDTFVLTATQSLFLRATLTHADGVDFDLSFLDPANDIFLSEDCDSATSPETCFFEIGAGESVRVEVEAFQGGGLYTLEID